MSLQEVASKLISATIPKDENGVPINPMDAHFKSLALTSMDPVARTTSEFATLADYVRYTHGQTHRMSVEILNAFRVERQAETDAWTTAQEAFARAYLDQNPDRDALQKAFTESYNYAKVCGRV